MDKLSENSSGVEERLTGRLPKGFCHLRQHAIPSMGRQVHFEDLDDPRTRNSSDFTDTNADRVKKCFCQVE